MKQLVLPIAPTTDSQDMRFLAKRLEHVPLPQVYRLLQPDSYRHWAPLSVLAVATARARHAPDDQWRRRLWWSRASALHRLRRTSERDHTARQAIWVLESDLESTSLQREGKRALDLRLLGWQLEDGDIAGARESALLLAPALLPLSSCGPVFSARLLTTFGALREALVGRDNTGGLERAGGHGDQPVPRTVRWAPAHHPLTAYYVGRSFARN